VVLFLADPSACPWSAAKTTRACIHQYPSSSTVGSFLRRAVTEREVEFTFRLKKRATLLFFSSSDLCGSFFRLQWQPNQPAALHSHRPR
jgi:hypothetical protein